MRVAKGSTAETAGLKEAKVSRDGGIVAGDIIVAVEGKPVDSVGKLLAIFDDYKIGSTVRISVLRGRTKLDIPVALQSGV